MNIAEILKDCPKETKLYCTIFGEVKLYEINLNEAYSITVELDNNSLESFTKDGKFYYNCDGSECILFPSKENRDWSTFKEPKKEKEYEFKPFDKVLVRDCDDTTWGIDLFGYLNIGIYPYNCLNGEWKECIPYEGNEHLLGKIGNPA